MGTSPRTIARLIDCGKLKGARVGGGHRYVMLSDLMAFDRCSREERASRLGDMRTCAAEEGFYDHGGAVADYLKGFE